MDDGGSSSCFLHLDPHLDAAFISLYVETFRPSFTPAVESMLQSFCEPVSRPEHVHCYSLTPYSLATAVSAGTTLADIAAFLSKHAHNAAFCGVTAWQEEQLRKLDAAKETQQRTEKEAGEKPASKKKEQGQESGGKTRGKQPVLSATEVPGIDVMPFLQQCIGAYNKAAIVHDTTGSYIVCRNPVVAETLGRDKFMVSLLDPLAAASAAADAKKQTQPKANQKQQQPPPSDREVTVIESDHSDPDIAVEETRALSPIQVKREVLHSSALSALSEGWIYGNGAADSDDAGNAADSGQQFAGPGSSSSTARPGQVVHLKLKDIGAAKAAAKRCTDLGMPLYQHYNYASDPSVRDANIILKPATKPRPYQMAAVASAASHAVGCIRSGVLVLPCGAGKTLVGVLAMAVVKKVTLIVCASAVAVAQWQHQLIDAADLLPVATTTSGEGGGGGGGNGTGPSKGTTAAVGANRIACLTGKSKEPIDDLQTDVVITTYAMLSAAHKYAKRHAAQTAKCTASVTLPTTAPQAISSGATQTAAAGAAAAGVKKRASRVDPRIALFRPYGLLILDEVHVVPADFFQHSLAYIDAKAAIGLTATYVREDRRILELFHLVGPKLFDLSWEVLCKQGYLAHVTCTELHTPMLGMFASEYIARCGSGDEDSSGGSTRKSKPSGLPNQQQPPRKNPAQLLTLLAASNPYKMLCARELVHRHAQDSGKVLVFCDHILLLKEYATFLGCPYVCGETQHKERLQIFSDFQATSKVNVVCVSRVGDVSVNLPAANVVIQVSSHGGSRRQEAQRLGRILRPKERSCDGRQTEAYFYSIVSSDTHEVAYAAKRSEFLMDLGYACRCATYVPSTADVADVDATAATVLAAATSALTGCAEAIAPVSGGRVAPAKALRVGDVTQVKREELFRFASGATAASGPRGVLHATVGTSSTARHPLQHTASRTRHVWCVGFLAKVVSSWELQFAAELRDAAVRRRKRQRSEEENGTDDADGEAVVPVAARRAGGGPRTARDVKEELFARGDAAALAAAQPWQRGALSELTSLGVDLVYHEF